MTRSALHWSQQRSSFTGHASLSKPTIAPPQIEQACTGIIVRAPLCAPEQAQQQGGRIELSNTRRGLLSPPQAKASVIRSWRAQIRLPAKAKACDVCANAAFRISTLHRRCLRDVI